MSLFDITTETTAVTLNSFLQYYNADSAVGITLTTTIENFQLELRVTTCPLLYIYNTWSGLTTDSWIKPLWEKVDKLGIDTTREDLSATTTKYDTN